MQLRKARCASTTAAERHGIEQQAGLALQDSDLFRNHCLPAHEPCHASTSQQQLQQLGHGRSHPLSPQPRGLSPMTESCTLPVSVVAPAEFMDLAFPQLVQATPAWAVARDSQGDYGFGGREELPSFNGGGLLLHRADSGGSGWESEEEDGGGHVALDSLVCLEDFNGRMSKVSEQGEEEVLMCMSKHSGC